MRISSGRVVFFMQRLPNDKDTRAKNTAIEVAIMDIYDNTQIRNTIRDYGFKKSVIQARCRLEIEAIDKECDQAVEELRRRNRIANEAFINGRALIEIPFAEVTLEFFNANILFARLMSGDLIALKQDTIIANAEIPDTKFYYLEQRNE